ncbi:MAG TPA: hypothetical protein VEW08_16360 [Steroidobacteraceae bacterium]|nr:hypothetical protein [Steroidobacteraceae bacterium]
MVDDLQKLRAGLSAMPVPEPRPGFVDRVLANASGGKAPEVRGIRAAIRRPYTWWAAGTGALAASLAWMALFFFQSGAVTDTRLVLALNESRDVPLVIDAERNLDGATIRLSVSGSIGLTGYGEQHEIEWTTSLTQGANLLSLPVFARSQGDGLVVAEIEHEGRTRRLSMALHVVAPEDDSA